MFHDRIIRVAIHVALTINIKQFSLDIFIVLGLFCMRHVQPFQSLLSNVASLFRVVKWKFTTAVYIYTTSPRLSACILRQRSVMRQGEFLGAGTDECLLCFITFSWFTVLSRLAIMHDFAARICIPTKVIKLDDTSSDSEPIWSLNVARAAKTYTYFRDRLIPRFSEIFN